MTAKSVLIRPQSLRSGSRASIFPLHPTTPLLITSSNQTKNVKAGNHSFPAEG